MDPATTHKLDGAARTLPCVAGALLTVRLGAGTRTLRLGLDQVGASARLCALPADNLPVKVRLYFSSKDRAVELDRADGLTLEVDDVDVRHDQLLALDLDVNAGSEFKLHQRIKRLLTRLDDVQKSLVCAVSNCSRLFLLTCGERKTV